MEMFHSTKGSLKWKKVFQIIKMFFKKNKFHWRVLWETKGIFYGTGVETFFWNLYF